MKIMPIMKACPVLMALLLVLAAVVPNTALAHSTAGLKQVALQKDEITVDNIAYYLERAVGKRVDEQGCRNCYYILTFDKIVQSGNPAEIHVTVADQKTGENSREILYLRHNKDGTWDHVDSRGKVMRAAIYTYVSPVDWWYWSKAALLGMLGAAGIAWLIFRRKKKALP